MLTVLLVSPQINLFAAGRDGGSDLPTEQDTLPRREVLFYMTNLLLDVAYMLGYNRWCPIPNLAIEYYPKKGHFTYGALFDFPW